MYSLRNFFAQSPTAMSGAIGAGLTQIALIGWSPLTDKQSLGVAGLVFLLLNLFYAAPLVSSNAKLQAISDAQDPPKK